MGKKTLSGIVGLAVLGVVLLMLFWAFIAGALVWGGWNLVAVTLFHCAPISYWQGLALFLVARIGFYLLAKK